VNERISGDDIGIMAVWQRTIWAARRCCGARGHRRSGIVAGNSMAYQPIMAAKKNGENIFWHGEKLKSQPLAYRGRDGGMKAAKINNNGYRNNGLTISRLISGGGRASWRS